MQTMTKIYGIILITDHTLLQNGNLYLVGSTLTCMTLLYGEYDLENVALLSYDCLVAKLIWS